MSEVVLNHSFLTIVLFTFTCSTLDQNYRLARPYAEANTSLGNGILSSLTATVSFSNATVAA